MKKIVNALAGALVLATMSIASPVLAATPSFDQAPTQGSTLTATLPVTNPNNDVPGPIRNGYTVEVSRVNGVDITTKNGYKRAAAVKLDDVDKLGWTPVATAVTDTSGAVAFKGLEAALYRVATATPKGHKNTMEISPVLVMLPGVNHQGRWAHSVELMLKPQPPTPPVPPEEIPNPRPTPPPPPPPPAEPTGKLPRTGASVFGLLGFAGLLIVVGAVASTRARSER